jgi:hypothetical protein
LLTLKKLFTRWARGNRRYKLLHLTARMISNQVEKQQFTLDSLRDSLRRKRIVWKTAGTCRMLELKEADNAQVLA